MKYTETHPIHALAKAQGLSAYFSQKRLYLYASSPEGCSGVAGLALPLRFALLWPRLRCAALMRTW